MNAKHNKHSYFTLYTYNIWFEWWFHSFHKKIIPFCGTKKRVGLKVKIESYKSLNFYQLLQLTDAPFNIVNSLHMQKWKGYAELYIINDFSAEQQQQQQK